MMQFYKPPKWPSQQIRQTKGGFTTQRTTYSQQSNSTTIYSPSYTTCMKNTQGMLDYNSDKNTNVSLTSLICRKHHGPHTKRKNPQHELQPQRYLGKCQDTYQRYHQLSCKYYHHADAPAYRKTCYNRQREHRGVRTALREGLQQTLSD